MAELKIGSDDEAPYSQGSNSSKTSLKEAFRKKIESEQAKMLSR